ncbi:MAG TPA: hypothetical protein VG797_07675 [Phycisphaerales bacterium]|nr:hypothetical protein [Phycisphaerales bacterium]
MKVPRLLANPIVSVLLFAGLWWTLAQLPVREVGSTGTSTLGELIRTAWRAMAHRARSGIHVYSPCLFVYRDEQGKVVPWFDGDSTPQPDQKPVALAKWRNAFWRESGFAFPTTRQASGVLTWYEDVPPLTDDEKQQLRSQFADAALAAWGGTSDQRELIGFLRQGDIAVTRPIYSGYFKNAGLLAILVAFILSLAWVPDAWRRFCFGSRAFRLECNQCPNCTYDIRGLPDRQCPECGAIWSEEKAARMQSKPAS